jgi:hypothetical protein
MIFIILMSTIFQFLSYYTRIYIFLKVEIGNTLILELDKRIKW